MHLDTALTFNRLDLAACMWLMSFQKSGAGQVRMTSKARHTQHMTQIRQHLGSNSNLYADTFLNENAGNKRKFTVLLRRTEIPNALRTRVLVSNTSPYGRNMSAESMPHMLQAAFKIQQLHLSLLIFSTKMWATSTSLLRRTEMQNVLNQEHW